MPAEPDDIATQLQSGAQSDTSAGCLAWPAVYSGKKATVLSLLYQFERSQWWPVEQLLEQQFRQVSGLLTFAQEHVPHYRPMIGELMDPRDVSSVRAAWQDVPVLTRQQLQQKQDALTSPGTPDDHGRRFKTSSSGSTGRPVEVSKTGVCNFFWQAFTVRDHLWQQRDFSRKLAVIRLLSGKQESSAKNWGSATKGLVRTGPVHGLHNAIDVARQAEWLCRIKPSYLLTYPSTLRALARYFIKEGLELPGFIEARTFGEALADDTRAYCLEAWGVPVTDFYSSQEIGYLALQCPAHEHYHVQSEGVLVEILDASGKPCAQGEVGRVVVTSLHNYATVLLRYEVGDYAEVGGPCDCGRGLPALTRILGRTRNILRLPDGREYRPESGIMKYSTIAPVEQAQLIQTSLNTIEAKLVITRALSESEEEQLRNAIVETLGFPFDVSLAYVDEVERNPIGKFEDFVSKVGDQ